MPRFEKVSAEIFVSHDAVLEVGSQDIEDLKAQARANEGRKARLCAHSTIEDPIHEMLIVHLLGAYIRPHKHAHKSESFHMIEGALDVVIFDEMGDVRRAVRLSAKGDRQAFFYRLSESLFHTVIPRSEIVVFHETTTGPFHREDTLFAPWAPAATHHAMVSRYQQDLLKKLDRGQ